MLRCCYRGETEPVGQLLCRQPVALNISNSLWPLLSDITASGGGSDVAGRAGALQMLPGLERERLFPDLTRANPTWAQPIELRCGWDLSLFTSHTWPFASGLAWYNLHKTCIHINGYLNNKMYWSSPRISSQKKETDTSSALLLNVSWCYSSFWEILWDRSPVWHQLPRDSWWAHTGAAGPWPDGVRSGLRGLTLTSHWASLVFQRGGEGNKVARYQTHYSG